MFKIHHRYDYIAEHIDFLTFTYYQLEISLYDFTLCSELTSKVAAAAAHLTIQVQLM